MHLSRIVKKKKSKKSSSITSVVFHKNKKKNFCHFPWIQQMWPLKNKSQRTGPLISHNTILSSLFCTFTGQNSCVLDIRWYLQVTTSFLPSIFTTASNNMRIPQGRIYLLLSRKSLCSTRLQELQGCPSAGYFYHRQEETACPKSWQTNRDKSI